MSQDTVNFEDIAQDIASYATDASSDIQSCIVIPAMLDIIGPVQGKDILDLSCGAGYMSRRLSVLGAKVTAIDRSERLIGIAREINSREEQTIKYAVADAMDLSVVEDSSFDDIVCNMGMMTTRDLAGTIAELARLVKLGGRFIFSVVHPCFSMPDACWAADVDGKPLYRTVDNYFSEGWYPSELIDSVRSEGRRIKHRTLSRYINALSARGFNVRRIVEPKPSTETLIIKPHLDIYNRVPAVMIVEAIFPYI